MSASVVTVKGFNAQAFNQNSIEPQGGHFLTVTYRLNFGAGDYVSGGLTLDWTNAGVNSGVPPVSVALPVSVKLFSNGPAASVGALGGNYQYIPGTLVTNGKVQIWKTAGSEYGATALLADVLTDVVFAEVKWGR